MTALAVVGFDPLRDSRHRSARAARECADWLAWLELEGKAPRTLDDYERTAAVLLRHLPHKTVGEFTDGDLAHVLRGFPAGSRRVRRAHLSSFFTWAKLTRRIDSNPLELVPRQRSLPQRVIDIFADEEIGLLEGLPSPDGYLFAILFGSGIRKGEARRLRRSHIHLVREQLIVYQGKGSKDRIIPLTKNAVSAVANLDLTEGLGRDDHLWYSRPGGGKVIERSRTIAESSFARWYRRCVDASGVRYLNPHATRHTYATVWRRRGLALDELRIVLGHSSVKTTSDLYVHTGIEDVARRIAEIEAGV